MDSLRDVKNVDVNRVEGSSRQVSHRCEKKNYDVTDLEEELRSLELGSDEAILVEF